MKDPIERQDAIDAVEDGCQEWKGIFQRCEANIKNLPSAQQEQRWISCGKGIFPEDGKEVLVTDGDHMMVAYYRNDAEAWDNYNFGWVEGRNEEMPYGINKVIAWMPLPEPYEGDQDDEMGS